MSEKTRENAKTFTGAWILVMLCVSTIIFTLTSGAAYTGVRSARLTAARASIGQIESVYFMAKMQAEADGLTPTVGASENMIKSYDNADAVVLSTYDRYILDSMMENFGPARDFDFAVSRFNDGDKVQLTVYYFPVLGHPDFYYTMTDGVITEKNV